MRCNAAIVGWGLRRYRSVGRSYGDDTSFAYRMSTHVFRRTRRKCIRQRTYSECYVFCPRLGKLFSSLYPSWSSNLSAGLSVAVSVQGWGSVPVPVPLNGFQIK